MTGIIKDKKKDRSFGLTVGILLIGYSAYTCYRSHTISLWLTVPGFIITIVAIFIPRVIQPFRKVMELAGHWMGIINTYVLLTLIYILLFIPVRLMYKMTGKDVLKLRRDNIASTYWIEKIHQEDSSMKNQF
jgi:hypothetical protein